MLKSLFFALLLVLTNRLFAQITFEQLKKDFVDTPSDTRPGCYWYWINDNVSKEGITKDLEAMKRLGIGRAYIGHIYDRRNETDTKPGPVKFMTKEWWTLLQWAVKEADRCGIAIGFFNSPGWSQSGGPWIDASKSMRYLANSDMKVNGGKKIDTLLSYPLISTYPNTRAARVRTGENFTSKDFQDVRVIAYKHPDGKMEQGRLPQNLTGPLKDINYLSDQNDSTSVSIETNQVIILSLNLSATEKEDALQNVIIKPIDHSFLLTCKVEGTSDGQNFNELITYTEERGHQGTKKTDPIVIPFKQTSLKQLRITLLFKPLANQKTIKLNEIYAGSEYLLNGYERKQLSETSPHTKIPWNAYVWDNQVPNEKGVAIQSNEVVDISDKMDSTGRLRWQAPAGTWTIQRFGMVPIGTQCHPCGPESLGFEVDKMNAEHVRAVFNGMVGEFLKRTPKEDRKALKYVIADSYETGPQNWTDNFIEKFKTRFSYSPIKYLPVLAGKVVDNPSVSDRFLWDMRRLVVESVAKDYVGGLQKICNENGLTLWLENYGHWGFISEFLLYGANTDEVGGEIWENTDPVTNVECRSAASSAHIYGKNDVYAEVFTSNRNFRQSPASLKKWADWSYSAGINHMILHVYIHQPDELKPGIIEWFGTAFNRHNTWFEQSKPFVDYMRRSSVLLKKGNPVADVGYYIGENAPSMTGPMDPKMPAGYDFDHINSDVLLNKCKVKNGRLVLESGVSYAVLVLPKVTAMRPEIAQVLQKLVAAGLIIIGPKPLESPSLQNSAYADRMLKSTADELWGIVDGKAHKARSYHAGWIYDGVTLAEVLAKHQIEKDLIITNSENITYGVAGDGKNGVDKTGSILFKHRHSAEQDIYFLSNTTLKSAVFDASFHITGKQPYSFNAVTAEIKKISEFKQVSGRTIISLALAESESIYIVFGEKINPTVVAKEKTKEKLINTINLGTDWNVTFPSLPNTTLKFSSLSDWTANSIEGIKYYSGTAFYEKEFDITLNKASRIVLDLGSVKDIVTIKINDQLVGTLWTNPWVIDITSMVKEGKNKLSLAVTNNWNNRLVGDLLLKTSNPVYVSQPYVYDKNKPLMNSGLLGPVSILQFR